MTVRIFVAVLAALVVVFAALTLLAIAATRDDGTRDTPTKTQAEPAATSR